MNDLNRKAKWTKSSSKLSKFENFYSRTDYFQKDASSDKLSEIMFEQTENENQSF